MEELMRINMDYVSHVKYTPQMVGVELKSGEYVAHGWVGVKKWKIVPYIITKREGYYRVDGLSENYIDKDDLEVTYQGVVDIDGYLYSKAKFEIFIVGSPTVVIFIDESDTQKYNELNEKFKIFPQIKYK